MITPNIEEGANAVIEILEECINPVFTFKLNLTECQIFYNL